MCGRFTLRTSTQELLKFFQMVRRPDWSPRFNIAPTQPVLAVRRTAAGREPSLLRWGLIPSWTKDPSVGSRLINARAETLAEKASFRSAFRHRRCLILADGFYEWKRLTNKTKQPMYVCRNDARPFAFAGLWERWENADHLPIESCTIITTEPNALLSPVHNRMPVILSPETYDQWLDPNCKETARLEPLLRPWDAEGFRIDPVSSIVNSPRNDVPECVQPIRSTNGLGRANGAV